ncbi:signal recognition particle-docking protein FtsY [Halosimplex aquaticum]|uniref:Signal recognition particle receptor FtsY n=1 Tax=Halosimplex aquaticum TaxID=3026162 RepID=A0ABD5Y3H0_9EURY|nr:signal recognition particle-docking protein FtsY [Halosimplex aquaticum]
MFDGLKEKLGRFSDDVEEDVDDEAVEEEPEDAAEAEAAETDAETADAGTADTEASDASAETDAASEPEETEADEPEVDEDDVDEDDVDEDESEEDGTEEAAEDDIDDADEEAAADDESGDDEDSDSDDAGRSLGERAKLLATGKTVIDEEDLENHLDDLEIALLQSDVEMGVAQEILDGVEENLVGETRRRLSSTGNLVRDALREALYDVISVGQFDFDERVAEADKPVVIVFTGVNGVGKTTTIAKLSRYFEERGLSSVLANGDTYRAGANEQLQQHADALDREVISHEQGSDPAAVIYDAIEYADAHDVDVVLGDTAGRLHTSDGLMDQLSKIDRVTDPDLTLFVDEAVAGQDAVNRAREFNDAAEIDGAVLTKADADPQGGAAISIAHVTGKPILFLGTGQDYDDLERFDPEEIVDRLIGEE